MKLTNRRIRADLVEVYKMVFGLSSVHLNTFFEFSSLDRTRGHSLKLKKNRFRIELRQHFFSERVLIYGINWMRTQSVLLH